jgi:hypothetical protein
MEVEWKWILAQDPSETNFPDAITTAPLYPDPSYPRTRKAKVAQKDIPEAEEMFGDDDSIYKWGELVVAEPSKLQDQEPVRNWWYYLGELSTEYIPKYSEDPRRRVHNNAANFVTPKPARQRAYKPQPAAIKQESGLHHDAMSPSMQQHINYQNPLRQPDYAMHHNLPPGYRPEFVNNQLIGYGPLPRNQYQPVPYLPVSPPNAPVTAGSSLPNYGGPHYTAAGLPPPAQSPQDRASALSLPLLQLFGEAPPPPPQQRPQYSSSPLAYSMSSPSRPMQRQAQSPTTPVYQHQQPSGMSASPPTHSSPMMPPPTPTQQYHSHPPASSYTLQPIQQSTQQQQKPLPYPQPHHPPPQLQYSSQPQPTTSPQQDSFSAFMGEVVAVVKPHSNIGSTNTTIPPTAVSAVAGGGQTGPTNTTNATPTAPAARSGWSSSINTTATPPAPISSGGWTGQTNITTTPTASAVNSGWSGSTNTATSLPAPTSGSWIGQTNTTITPTAPATSGGWSSSAAPLADITAAIAKLARERAERMAQQQQQQQQLQAHQALA